MMRPADHRLHSSTSPSSSSTASSSSVSSSLHLHPHPSWTGSVDEDWAHARMVLHSLGTDGLRISLWKKWLGEPAIVSYPIPPQEKGKQKSEEDMEVEPSPTPLPEQRWVVQVLKVHVRCSFLRLRLSQNV